MKNIYVVMYDTGSYDDAQTCAVQSSFDKNKLEVYVEGRRRLFARGQEVRQIIEDRMKIWGESNPKPAIKPHKPHKIPSFDGIKEKDITQEMRDERKRLRAENDKMQSDALQPVVAWGKTRMAHYNAEKSTFTSEEQEWMYADSHSNWRIEEVPFLE